MQLTYEREVALLAAEMMQDDPSLTEAEACKQAREQMVALYRTALEWNKAVAAQRSQRVTTA